MFPSFSQYDDRKWLHPRACKTCRKIRCSCKADELQSRAATCSICTLALVMRDCDSCAFQQIVYPVELSVHIGQLQDSTK